MEAWIVMSWWEPCNIKVSPYCLLPDTICDKCLNHIENYYTFVKQSLHNIVILETQFSIQQSCLKSKRKIDQCLYTDFDHIKADKGVQTEDYLDLISERKFNFEEYRSNFMRKDLYESDYGLKLVEYEINSNDSEDWTGSRSFGNAGITNLLDTVIPNKEVDFNNGTENVRKNVPKIYENILSKRKSKVPQKIDPALVQGEEDAFQDDVDVSVNVRSDDTESRNIKIQTATSPPINLSCDTQSLAAQVPEVSEIAKVTSPESADSCREKTKKKLPNLVKIIDLKKSDSYDLDDKSSQEPPRLLPSFVCSNCPGEFTNKSDLLKHAQVKHLKQAAYLCGLCTQQCSSLTSFKCHVEICSRKQQTTNRFICKVCKYSDDNIKSLENHIVVHAFLINDCRKNLKIFDPADYIEINESATTTNSLVCIDCGFSDFATLTDFSNHRRNYHSIFHCDLCDKSYGRNSHLWKHVKKLHQGHPSITCQVCYKTSASKHQLLQHFNKVHMLKDDKETLERTLNSTVLKCEKEELLPMDVIKCQLGALFDPPKEIDPSHNLYNNIITNYSPPVNDGEFKCEKCCKGFHRNSLLRKHKRNCRPKLQKDLLTRCKSCSRIFKDRQSLAKHLVNYHSDYSCEICNEIVQSKCEIVSHIRFQHPDCNLICTMCRNVLRSKADLQEHLLNHQDSHICQFCGDNLTSKIKLKMHILSLHRKILSLSCGICLKLFENQQVLKDHVTLLHKDELTPLSSCPVCAKNFRTKWKTFDHINKAHGNYFKTCRTCLEVFNNEAQLQAHCDVLSHGPSSAFNTSMLRNTIMAMVKCVVEQNVENNNEKQENDPEPFLMQDETKMMLLESLQKKRPSEEYIEVPSKKLKTDLKRDEYAPVMPAKRTVYLNGDEPAACEICLKTWPAKKHLWQHYIRRHKSEAATVCGICLKTNDSYEELQNHLKEAHPKLLHGQGGSRFICRICGRYHNASSKLRMHMAIHTNCKWNLENDPVTFKEQTVDLNYENLIEQIECSSSDDDDDGEIHIELSKDQDDVYEDDFETVGSSSDSD